MEARRLLAVLTVDNSDLDEANASDTDKLFAGIYEAVEAASPGDQIKVEAGTYKPFVVAVGKDNLTIREANANSNSVIDADGGFYGVKIEADGVTVRGPEARNATAGVDEGFAFTVSGSNNKLINNVGIDSTHGFDINGILGDGDGNVLIGNTARGNDFGFEVTIGADRASTSRTFSDSAMASGRVAASTMHSMH